MSDDLPAELALSWERGDIPGSCDWGACDCPSAGWARSRSTDGDPQPWLPICRNCAMTSPEVYEMVFFPRDVGSQPLEGFSFAEHEADPVAELVEAVRAHREATQAAESGSSIARAADRALYEALDRLETERRKEEAT